MFLRKWAHVLRKEPTENDSCPPEHTGATGGTILLNEWLLHLKQKQNLLPVCLQIRVVLCQETPKPRDLNRVQQVKHDTQDASHPSRRRHKQSKRSTLPSAYQIPHPDAMQRRTAAVCLAVASPNSKTRKRRPEGPRSPVLKVCV